MENVDNMEKDVILAPNITNWTKEFDPELLINQYMHNRKVDDPAFHILIFMYSLLILVGAAGNTLVVSPSIIT